MIALCSRFETGIDQENVRVHSRIEGEHNPHKIHERPHGPSLHQLNIRHSYYGTLQLERADDASCWGIGALF